MPDNIPKKNFFLRLKISFFFRKSTIVYNSRYLWGHHFLSKNMFKFFLNNISVNFLFFFEN